ncbi:MAG: hypothetical protein HC899_38060 [Leptolyngbyaceae cyanobacterium SM1_4_3]|nr:hypothetical protein [Leptolyngbyaceae cyanobacterium SM1_4_3]
MKRFKKLGLFALGLLSVVPSALAPVPAIAQSTPDIFRDSAGNVYVQNAAATTLASGGRRIITNEPLTRSIRAGFCGELVISTSTTLPAIGNAWTVGTTNVSRPTTTVTNREALPTCRNAAFVPAASGSFVDATTPGRDRVVLTGYAPGQSYQVQFTGINSSQTVTQNQCGFFRLSNTQTNPLPTQLTINGSAVTVASLPVAAPPLCQRQSNGSYIRYVPTP